MARRRASARPTNPLKEKNNLPYSMLVARQEIDLHSNEAQSLLPHFKRANIALYQLDIILPRRTTEEKAANLQRVVYDEIIQPLEKYLQAEYVKVHLLYQQCVQGPITSFSKPLKTSVDLAHPAAQRLLDLLVGLDGMYRQLADLWFGGQIKDDTYVEVRTDCRNALKEAMKRIAHLVRAEPCTQKK